MNFQVKPLLFVLPGVVMGLFGYVLLLILFGGMKNDSDSPPPDFPGKDFFFTVAFTPFWLLAFMFPSTLGFIAATALIGNVVLQGISQLLSVTSALYLGLILLESITAVYIAFGNAIGISSADVGLIVSLIAILSLVGSLFAILSLLYMMTVLPFLIKKFHTHVGDYLPVKTQEEDIG